VSGGVEREELARSFAGILNRAQSSRSSDIQFRVLCG
jgi:hypothetical protein